MMFSIPPVLNVIRLLILPVLGILNFVLTIIASINAVHGWHEAFLCGVQVIQ